MTAENTSPGTDAGQQTIKNRQRATSNGQPESHSSFSEKATHVIALDFDGIICDSANETVASGWRAGKSIWQNEWRREEPSPEVVRRFRSLRPFMHTGYEAIAMTRMAYEGVEGEELDQEKFDDILNRTIDATGLSREELIHIFAAARDKWIKQEPEVWLRRNIFYEGAGEMLTKLAEDHPLFIVTTKQRRFAEKLLAENCPEARIRAVYGLRDMNSKEEVLDKLMCTTEFAAAAFHFVEDRLRTLARVRQTIKSARLRLYLAAWGYNTVEDRRKVLETEDIKLLNEPGELACILHAESL